MGGELLAAALAIIASLEPNSEISDESISDLCIVLSDTLVIAALDLIDRGNVLKYVTPWGKIDYEVIGTTATYHIQLDLPSRVPFYCTCPAFSYAVLVSGSHAMCKHVLATLFARKLDACMERTVTIDEMVEILSKQFARNDI